MYDVMLICSANMYMCVRWMWLCAALFYNLPLFVKMLVKMVSSQTIPKLPEL